jgi:SMC interacting uncharacterized protein involved in chromosome segregation
MKSRVRITERLASKQAASSRREIPEDFKYNKKKLKHLKHVLHNVNVALGTLVSAHNEFSRVKGPDISPDGMLGGLGYILPIKDIKEALNGCIRNLSDISDSLADELTNPHWETEDDSEVKKLIKEKEEIEEKVEEEVEEGDGTEEEDGGITPQDIITSRDFETKKATDEAFAKIVRKSLARFSSIGKQKNINKE